MKNETDDLELEELNLEEAQENEDFSEEEEWVEEQNPVKAGTAVLVFLGLMILAALICGILWKVTHGDAESGGNTVVSSEASDEAAGEDSAAEADREPETENETEQEVQASDAESAAEPESESDAEANAEEEASSESSRESVAEEEPVSESNSVNRVSTKDGRVIVFTDCDDVVSPKEYVNLRLEPSTSEGNATVHCRLEYGETVKRTGISEDSGWSRVEKDGVVCYVVTSYVYVIEE